MTNRLVRSEEGPTQQRKLRVAGETTATVVGLSSEHVSHIVWESSPEDVMRRWHRFCSCHGHIEECSYAQGALARLNNKRGATEELPARRRASKQERIPTGV